MAGRIPQQFIDELMARVDIVDVIDEHVSLKAAGKEHKACCPFHDEKTPSFTVVPDKQFYHCFGCGAHGTVIGFLMDYAHMEFVEVVEELAQRAGLTIPYEESQEGSRDAYLELYELHEQATAIFSRQLRQHPTANQAVDYLKQRGLSGEIASEFEIGFAPDGWDHLLKALGDSKKKHLVQAGLAIEKDNGQCYDRFRERIMFPIRDRRGRVVGFGGRSLGGAEPKYLNSPETPIFHKGRELYGLFQARRQNRQLTRLLVVEGYMDVVALAQFDIRYAVAALGTAITAEHIDRLFRTAADIVFCFDGDEAGRRAAWRALQTTLPAMRDGRQALFLFLPEGEDPDTMVRRDGRAAFEARVDASISLSAFLFGHLTSEVNMDTIDGRARLIELAKPLLTTLPGGAFKRLMAKRLGELSGDEESSTLLAGEKKRGRYAESRQARVPQASGHSPVRRVITLLLHYPELVSRLSNELDLQSLATPGVPLLVELLSVLKEHAGLTTGGLLERFRDHESERHLARLATVDVPPLNEGLEQEFRDAVAQLFRAGDLSRIEELQRKDRECGLDEAERQEFAALIAGLSGQNKGE